MKGLKVFALTLAAATVMASTASSQFVIKIPKIPKISKERVEEKPQATTSSSGVRPNETEPTSPRAETVAPEAKAKPVDCTYSVLGVYIEQMEITRKQAEEYTPGLRGYYVQDFNDNQNMYLWAALSSQRRQKWYEETKWSQEERTKCLDPLFDAISAAVKRTLPTYQPTGYAAATAAEAQLIKGRITDIKDAVVFKTGVKPGPWKVSKNSLGIPTDRYKHGMVWVKYPSNEDGFCRIFFVNIVQDYAGGGTYGASYGHYVSLEPSGCPAGK